jgi:prepilin-type N-terminal cleavage/methylation domain-containing protein
MNKHKGFTIVELLIVIVIIGILAAISIVAYNGITQKARESATKQETAQTERQIMSFASLNGESADKVSGAMVGYKEGPGESKLLKPLIAVKGVWNS